MGRPVISAARVEIVNTPADKNGNRGEPGHVELIGIEISLITLTATGINVYVGLRLAALQAKIKASGSQRLRPPP
jgi:hypothetical protein